MRCDPSRSWRIACDDGIGEYCSLTLCNAERNDAIEHDRTLGLGATVSGGPRWRRALFAEKPCRPILRSGELEPTMSCDIREISHLGDRPRPCILNSPAAMLMLSMKKDARGVVRGPIRARENGGEKPDKADTPLAGFHDN